MKRVIVLTVVLFVLSLGGLAAVTLWMCRAQDQVEFTNIVSRGEDAAARGLYVTEHDNLSGRVHWATQHDLGNGSRETKTTFSGKGTTYEGMTVGDFAAYSIYAQLPEAPQMEEYLRAHMDSGGYTATLRPADYAEYYDLCLGSTGSWPMITRWDKQEEDYDDFPAMRIPVGAEDRIKLNVYSYGSGMRYSLSEIVSVNCSFIPWGVTVEAGSVVTVHSGRNSAACAASSARLFRATSPTTWKRSGSAASAARALLPIEPVAPSMTTPFRIYRDSARMVTGPSFRIETSISAPNLPVATRTPYPRQSSTNFS